MKTCLRYSLLPFISNSWSGLIYWFESCIFNYCFQYFAVSSNSFFLSFYFFYRFCVTKSVDITFWEIWFFKLSFNRCLYTLDLWELETCYWIEMITVFDCMDHLVTMNWNRWLFGSDSVSVAFDSIQLKRLDSILCFFLSTIKYLFFLTTFIYR